MGLFSFQTKSKRNISNPEIARLKKDCFSFLVGQPARFSKLEMDLDQKNPHSNANKTWPQDKGQIKVIKPQKNWKPKLIHSLGWKIQLLRQLMILSHRIQTLSPNLNGACFRDLWLYFIKVIYNITHRKPTKFLKELCELRLKGTETVKEKRHWVPSFLQAERG